MEGPSLDQWTFAPLRLTMETDAASERLRTLHEPQTMESGRLKNHCSAKHEETQRSDIRVEGGITIYV